MENPVARSRVPESVYKGESDKSNPHGEGKRAGLMTNVERQTCLAAATNNDVPELLSLHGVSQPCCKGGTACIRRCLCGQEAAAPGGASSFGCYTHSSRGDDGCVRENAGKIHNCCNCTLLRLLWSTRKAASQAQTFLTPSVC